MLEVTREMGCSVDDLIRWFPLAMGDFCTQTSLHIDGIEIFHPEKPLISIVGFTRAPRKIALLSIPVLSLRFMFDESLGSADCGRIIECFDLYPRRGGG